MKTGLYYEMPASEYFSIDAASNSTLSRMIPTPAHCKNYMENPPASTPAMAFGSLVHTMILEREKIPDEYAAKPEGIDRRTKQGKLDWADFELESQGKKIVTLDDMATANKMAKAIKHHPTASAILAHGRREVSAFWDDKTTGELCKGRMDWVNEETDLLADVKTTPEASATAFSRAMVSYGYYRQAAMYSDGYLNITGRLPDFYFIVIENKPPHCVAVYQLDYESFKIGQDEYRSLLIDWANCKSSDEWPGYSDKIEQISLPHWKLIQNIEGIV